MNKQQIYIVDPNKQETSYLFKCYKSNVFSLLKRRCVHYYLNYELRNINDLIMLQYKFIVKIL